MLCHCPISGIRWHADYVALSKPQIAYHPIFNWTQREIYDTALNDFWANKYNKMDNYLLVLALLKSTGLVEWHAPCTPTKATYTRAMRQLPALFDIIEEMNKCARLPAALQPIFPRIVINQENNDLSLLSAHINVWQDVINDTRARVRDTAHENELKISESKFTHALHDANINGRQLGIIASRWLTATLDWHPVADMQWRRMIITAAQVARYNTDENRLPLANQYKINEWHTLENYLTDNLELGTTYRSIIMHWITTVKGCLRAQYAIGQSVDDNGRLTIDTSVANPGNQAIIRIIETSPIAPPKIENYKSRLDYLRALAAYNTAKNITLTDRTL